jgi:hypothetical protein
MMATAKAEEAWPSGTSVERTRPGQQYLGPGGLRRAIYHLQQLGLGSVARDNLVEPAPQFCCQGDTGVANHLLQEDMDMLYLNSKSPSTYILPWWGSCDWSLSQR